ncbi:hypothetical protein [Acinetobacter proteolyticus]|uniref:Uncharacterized protein n=1 Tax=Acinetobacter proteolyticus TaxID=1776741 RepID=A0A2N0WEW7_9GAMM|nr:hypothetical protein [Acinetobacter proteolyticus]PKF33420.1 hypothetical protein CW311_11500 [Acinetobacter proteolyticus]
MFRILFALILLVTSLKTLANTNVNEDVLFQKIGMLDSDFRYMDMNLVNRVFKNANDRTEKQMPYKSNDLIELTSITLTPYLTIINFTNTFDLSEVNQNKFSEYFKTQESIKDWCSEHFKFKYMRVNNLKVEVNYKNRYGKILESIVLNRETCS